MRATVRRRWDGDTPFRFVAAQVVEGGSLGAHRRATKVAARTSGCRRTPRSRLGASASGLPVNVMLQPTHPAFGGAAGSGEAGASRFRGLIRKVLCISVRWLAIILLR
jgi:hypothetical protein